MNSLLQNNVNIVQKQLTLLDLPPFVKIAPEELSDCGWTTKAKWERSPNVCAMTQRFNNVSCLSCAPKNAIFSVIFVLILQGWLPDGSRCGVMVKILAS